MKNDKADKKNEWQYCYKRIHINGHIKINDLQALTIEEYVKTSFYFNFP